MQKLYAIRDVLSGFVVRNDVPLIINLPNDDVARRVVQDACANGAQPNYLNVHPEHKELWRLGSMDLQSGVITPCEPVCVARAIEFIGKETIVDDTSHKSCEDQSV